MVEDLDTQCAIATDDVDLHPCLSTWADWGAVQRDFFVIGVDGALLHKINLTPGFFEGPIDAIVQAALADVPGSTVNGVRAPTCADSPPQLCRMRCPDTVCPTGQCAMRAGSCCDLSCQGGGGSDCVGDVNNDRSINVTDLLQLLGQFGSSGAGGEDITGDGTVSVTDLLQVRPVPLLLLLLLVNLCVSLLSALRSSMSLCNS